MSKSSPLMNENTPAPESKGSSEKAKLSFGKILLIVFLLAVLALAVFAFLQRDNIKAFYRGVTTTPEQIDKELVQNEKSTVDALSNEGFKLTDEDFNKISDGSLSAEEIAALLLDSQNAEKETPATNPDASGLSPDESGVPSDPDPDSEDQPKADDTQNPPATLKPEKPADKKPDKTTPTVPDKTQQNQPNGTVNPPADTANPGEVTVLSEEEYNRKVAELVAQVYVIKANFVSTLSSFESRIISEYKALPKEQQTTATKAKIVSDNMGYISGLEAQCNAQVKSVTDQLTVLMQENGKDTSLVAAINDAYAKEKELKKAYYISLYK